MRKRFCVEVFAIRPALKIPCNGMFTVMIDPVVAQIWSFEVIRQVWTFARMSFHTQRINFDKKKLKIAYYRFIAIT